MAENRALSAPPRFAELMEQRSALFLDFDGTLVELAPTPDTIAVRAGLGDALVQLRDRLAGRLALVSGRSVSDIRKYLGDIPVAIAGSHGGEIVSFEGVPIGQSINTVSDAVRSALRAFADNNGLGYEEKTQGAALHYRARQELEAEAQSFAQDLAAQHDLATKRGKCVIELVPHGVDKGRAVETLLEQAEYGDVLPLFIGDDVTDEDGFKACNRKGGAGICVGTRAETSATYQLRDVAAVHKWLELEF